MMNELVIDEAERSRVPGVGIDWDVCDAGLVSVAQALGRQAIGLVSANEFESAAAVFRVLGEVTVESQQGSARVLPAMKQLHKHADQMCAARFDESSDPILQQQILLARFWIAWNRGKGDEHGRALLGGIIELGSSGSWQLETEARILKARQLGICDQVDAAAVEFEGVVVQLQSRDSEDARVLRAEALYAQCSIFCQNDRWAETLAIAGEFDQAYAAIADPADYVRVQLAETAWCACIAMARLRVERSGSRGVEAETRLDQLIASLRTGDIPALKRLLAERLVDKLRWRQLSDDALDVLDEIASALSDAGDRSLSRRIIGAVFDQCPALFDVSEEEDSRMKAAAVEALRSGRTGLPEGLLDGTTVQNQQRLFEALKTFTGWLKDDPCPEARDLYAVLLFYFAAVTGRVGDDVGSRRMIDEFCTLGESALTACDVVVEHGVGLAGDDKVTNTMIMMPVYKAYILESLERPDEALAVLDDVIDSQVRAPSEYFQVMMENVRSYRAELLE